MQPQTGPSGLGEFSNVHTAQLARPHGDTNGEGPSSGLGTNLGEDNRILSNQTVQLDPELVNQVYQAYV